MYVWWSAPVNGHARTVRSNGVLTCARRTVQCRNGHPRRGVQPSGTIPTPRDGKQAWRGVAGPPSPSRHPSTDGRQDGGGRPTAGKTPRHSHTGTLRVPGRSPAARCRRPTRASPPAPHRRDGGASGRARAPLVTGDIGGGGPYASAREIGGAKNSTPPLPRGDYRLVTPAAGGATLTKPVGRSPAARGQPVPVQEAVPSGRAVPHWIALAASSATRGGPGARRGCTATNDAAESRGGAQTGRAVLPSPLRVARGKRRRRGVRGARRVPPAPPPPAQQGRRV